MLRFDYILKARPNARHRFQRNPLGCCTFLSTLRMLHFFHPPPFARSCEISAVDQIGTNAVRNKVGLCFGCVSPADLFFLLLSLPFLSKDGLLSSLFLLGRKFNKNGELTAQWWSQDSLDGFKAKAKCVENQYWMYKVRDKYPVSESILQAINVSFVFLQDIT